jgi:glucokinase
VTRWLGLDIGGQSLKAVIVDENGKAAGHATRPTGRTATMRDLAISIGELASELGHDAGRPIGVGVAGCVTLDGIVRGSPNLPALAGSAIERDLGKALGTSVVADNDAHCHALAEAWVGAAERIPTFLLVTLGSGIGSGLVIGGKVHRGATGYGCELGHSIFRPGGRRCGCGNRGCLEAYVSEVALGSRIPEEVPGLARRVDALTREHGRGRAHALFELADTGDTEAAVLADLLAEELGTAFGSAVNVFDVELIVIGGGIAPGILARLPRLRRAMAGALFAREEAAVRIVPASVGVLAGAVGAARLAMTAV